MFDSQRRFPALVGLAAALLVALAARGTGMRILKLRPSAEQP